MTPPLAGAVEKVTTAPLTLKVFLFWYTPSINMSNCVSELGVVEQVNVVVLPLPVKFSIIGASPTTLVEILYMRISEPFGGAVSNVTTLLDNDIES